MSVLALFLSQLAVDPQTSSSEPTHASNYAAAQDSASLAAKLEILFALEREEITLGKISQLFDKNFRILKDFGFDGRTYETIPPDHGLRVEFFDNPQTSRIAVEISFRGRPTSNRVPLSAIEQQLNEAGWRLWSRYEHPSRMLLFGRQGMQIRMEHNGISPITIILLGE